ncbi:hypothetical protein BJ741DRAFT_630056 [Chytriomyces cf. hyalinus JEL632]|nr:hypothetical protein BJ741DRAFT_630056 [Chytriomyces cf. hyalinus JEL632]
MHTLAIPLAVQLLAAAATHAQDTSITRLHGMLTWTLSSKQVILFSTDNIFIPFNIATGAVVSATSASTTGACFPNRCAASNVISLTTNTTGQWVSSPGVCNPTRSETLSLDWSQNFGVQFITEVRYHFGALSASNANLVVYDTQPMNINNPTAVTYTDTDEWIVYVFEVPVTATSLSFTWSGLSSPDGNVSCAVGVRDIEVWTGPSPNGLSGVTRPRASLFAGAIVGIVLGTLLASSLLFLGVFVLFQRRKNLMARMTRGYELGRFGGERLRDDGDAVHQTGFDVLGAKMHSARTRNFLAANVDAANASSAASSSSTRAV